MNSFRLMAPRHNVQDPPTVSLGKGLGPLWVIGGHDGKSAQCPLAYYDWARIGLAISRQNLGCFCHSILQRGRRKHDRCPLWVKTGKARNELIFSCLPPESEPKAAVTLPGWTAL